MVLMCQRLLPETERPKIYLQGASSFKLSKSHFTVKVYCSSHNPGAKELAEELNACWPGLLRVAEIGSWNDMSSCDHMLVYLNAITWAYMPELLAAEIREAMHVGLHLQVCNELPSVLDPGSARGALEFKRIMDATPADLKQWPTNIYSQIAIALKGGELREPGLANLAARLTVRVPLTPVEVLLPSRSDHEVSTPGDTVAGLIKSTSRDIVVRLLRVTSRVEDKVRSSSSRTSINQIYGSNIKSISERESRKSEKHRETAAADPSHADPDYNEASIGGVRPGDEEEAS
eukprot:7380576-Prymnesium_polylepis.1